LGNITTMSQNDDRISLLKNGIVIRMRDHPAICPL
jgi:hypothetical protein